MDLGDEATVSYNASSGNGDGVGVEEIERCLQEQGFQPKVHRTDAASDLDEILPDASGLVITCGGDGTFSAACERLVGRDDVWIAHLPLGTANNVAHALGIPSGSLEALADLTSRTPQEMDLGVVRHSDRTVRFVEGFGCGVFAELLREYDPSKGKSVRRAFETLVDVLPSFEPMDVQASVDGDDMSGAYLLFAVLNTKRIGPQIELAPNADPCDGQVEIVGVQPDGRKSLLMYAEARMAGDIEDVDGVVLRRGRDVEIEPDGFTFRLDSETFETTDRSEGDDRTIYVSVDDATVTTLAQGRCE